MVMMSMPMIVSMTIALVLGVVPLLMSPPWHRQFEVFGTVWMVMVLTKGPMIKQWISGEQSRLGTVRIFDGGRPRVVVKVIE